MFRDFNDFQNKLLHLEITKKCPLSCSHCYNESGFSMPHSVVNWRSIIQEAAQIGFRGVQFIGGEPFVYPQLYNLVDYARSLSLEIEIYSNLAVPVRFDRLDKKVKLATSFYSCEASIHDAITGGVGSWERTVAQIRKALEVGFALRVGMVKFPNHEKESDIISFLENLGVSRHNLKIDRIRQFGRGADNTEPTVNELCRECGKTAAILFDGTVTSCPMARFISYGNVSDSSLAEAIFSEQAQAIRKELANRFKSYDAPTSGILAGCNPDHCDPDLDDCDPDLNDCDPNHTCTPDFGCNPTLCNPDLN
jgi:MoaA/NifB/PqqE/SkfB family radical SAM enzyme